MEDMSRHRAAIEHVYGKDTKRCTGRTTRMLQSIPDQLDTLGRHVIVICAHNRGVLHVKKMAMELLGPEMTARVHFTSPDRISSFTWQRGLDASRFKQQTIALIDHEAIESRFGWLLEEVTRWDEKSDASP